MNTRAFLESVEQSTKNRGDFLFIRTIDDFQAHRLDLNNRNVADDLKELLPHRIINIFLKDISHWVNDFSNSNTPCSIKTFSDQKGTSCSLVVERVSNKPGIFIFGAGHVGQALALTSVLLGYEVIVVDDRVEFASRKRLPDPRIKLIVSDFAEAIKSLNIGPRSAAVIVTRGHQFDEICLENLLKLPISYLGMIGSRRRVLSIFKRLSKQGFADSDLSKVHAPIGLSIGAKSPQEIAIAILAEIIAEANRTSLNA